MTFDPRIHWLDLDRHGRLAIVSRPRHVDHFALLKVAGVDVVVSLLDEEEARAVGLGEEAELCRRAGLEFFSLPVVDHGIPVSFEAVLPVVEAVAERLAAGRAIAAHCFVGLGRSPLFIGSVLVHQGFEVGAAFDLVSAARGHRVPEMDGQFQWVADFADWLANSRGVASVRRA